MGGLHREHIVLVTGASGFLGRHCLARLAREACVVHATSRKDVSSPCDRTVWHQADLFDPVAIGGLLRTVRPTHMLHLAWTATPGRFWCDHRNLDWLESGVALLRNFGEIGGTRFVGVGTCAEYDWRAQRFVEDETLILPRTLYGKAKAAMAVAADAFSARYGFSAAWARIFQPYGPGEAQQRLIPSIINSLIAQRPISLSEGTQERDFIYAPDVADLLVRLLAADGAVGPFNVGTGRATSVRAVAECIADRFSARHLLTFGSLSSGADEPHRMVADMGKVISQLSWPEPTPIQLGLRATVDDVVAQRHAVRLMPTEPS